MITKIKTSDMSREAWREERRKSIGGSEIGAILGLSKYASPISVWANKVGKLPDKEPNEAMRQGTDLEEYVARRFTEKSGMRVERVNYLLRNDAYPHIHADIDRRVIGIRAGLECKTASALSTARFTGGEFPSSYYAQCVSYMAVTEYPRWFLAVLILGKDFKIYMMTTIQEDEVPDWVDSSVYVGPNEFAGIREAAMDFWPYVERGEEPPADGIPATAETLAALHPESNGDVIDLFGCDQLFEQYAAAKEAKERWAETEDAIANQLKQRLGDYETGVCGVHTVTWKSQNRKTFSTKDFQREHPELDLSPFYKTSSFRKFTVKETKS